MFRITQDPSSGSVNLYLTEITYNGSNVLIMCVFGVWRHIVDLWLCVCVCVCVCVRCVGLRTIVIKFENYLLPFRSMLFKYIVHFYVILSLCMFVCVSNPLKHNGLCSYHLHLHRKLTLFSTRYIFMIFVTFIECAALIRCLS